MIEKNIQVKIDTKFDVRPTAVLVQIASQYDSSVYVFDQTNKYNAKSIMGMMSLGLKEGDRITVAVNGSDEQNAMQSIEKYLLGEAE